MPIYIIHSGEGETLYEGKDMGKALEKAASSKGEVYYRRYTPINDGRIELICIQYYNGKSQDNFSSRQILCRSDVKTLSDMLIENNNH